MKISALIIVLILSLFFISCSKSEELQVKQPNSKPLLEMSTELVGLWDVNGEMLDFRLYDNGFVEFDTLDNSKKDPKKSISKTNELKVKKQGYVSEQEVEKVLNMLKSDKFLDLKNTYTAKRAGTDNSINNTIVFQYESKEKTIKILSHLEDLSNPKLENFPDFPPVLSDLYRQIDQIKSKLPVK